MAVELKQEIGKKTKSSPIHPTKVAAKKNILIL